MSNKSDLCYGDHGKTCQGRTVSYLFECSPKLLKIQELDAEGNVVCEHELERNGLSYQFNAQDGTVTLFAMRSAAEIACNLSAGGTYNDNLVKKVNLYFQCGTGGHFYSEFGPDNKAKACDASGAIPSEQLSAALSIIDECINSCCGDFPEPEIEKIPAVSGVMANLPNAGMILSAGSVGPFIQYVVDQGNDGTFEYESAYAPHDPATELPHNTGLTLADGDVVGVRVALDAMGTMEMEQLCLIPDSTLAIVDGSDPSAVLVDFSGVFDSETSLRSFTFHLYDQEGNLYILPAITGAESFTGYSLNISQYVNEGEGFRLDLYANDEKLMEITPSMAVYSAIPMPIINSISDTKAIDWAGTVGDYVRVTLDNGSDGSIEEDSGFVLASGVSNPYVLATEVIDGATITLEAAYEPDGSDAVSVSCVIPDSAVQITSALDYSAVVVDINGSFDPNTTQRNFLLEVFDSSDLQILSLPLMGTDLTRTETLDLSGSLLPGEGFSVRVVASDEKTIECVASTDCVIVVGLTSIDTTPSMDDIINASATFAPFINVSVDQGSDGSYEYESGFVNNAPGNAQLFLSGLDIQDGDTVRIQGAKDDMGTGLQELFCQIPDSTVQILDASDLTQVQLQIDGVFGPTSDRNFQVEVLSEDGLTVLGTLPGYMGADESITPIVDLSALVPTATGFQVRVTASDEKLSEREPSTALYQAIAACVLGYNQLADLIEVTQSGAPGTIGPFLQAEIVNEGITGAIIPNDGVASPTAVHILANGDILGLNVYDDAAGTTLLTQDQRQVPNPSIGFDLGAVAGGGTPVTFQLGNPGDSVQNTINPGNYNPADDTFAVSVQILDFQVNGNNYAGGEFLLVGPRGSAIDTAQLEQDLINGSVGLSPADAATFVAGNYFSGTLENLVFDAPNAGTDLGLTTVNMNFTVVHNYGDGKTLEAVSLASLNYEHCNLITNGTPSEDCSGWSVTPTDDGNGLTYTVELVK